MQEALNVQTMDGLARFVLTVLKLTLAFEFAGAVMLTARWTSEYGFGQAASGNLTRPAPLSRTSRPRRMRPFDPETPWRCWGATNG